MAKKILKIHECDNVAIVLYGASRGERFEPEGAFPEAAEDIPQGAQIVDDVPDASFDPGAPIAVPKKKEEEHRTHESILNSLKERQTTTWFMEFEKLA